MTTNELTKLVPEIIFYILSIYYYSKRSKKMAIVRNPNITYIIYLSNNAYRMCVPNFCATFSIYVRYCLYFHGNDVDEKTQVVFLKLFHLIVIDL